MNREKLLDDETIKKVEKDLRSFPDWLIRNEVGGLGSPSRYGVEVEKKNQCYGSSVEYEFELSEEIKIKIEIISRVYERLHGKAKDIIENKYFQDYSRDDVLRMLKITKRKYYYLRDKALECFARALGYVE
jgi:DNA-directed RNA polymerase specialized sigma subunit